MFKIGDSVRVLPVAFGKGKYAEDGEGFTPGICGHVEEVLSHGYVINFPDYMALFFFPHELEPAPIQEELSL